MPPGLIRVTRHFLRRERKLPTLFAFGKLPQFGDFVSRNLEDAPWLARFFEELAASGRRGHENPWLDLALPARRIFLRRRTWLLARGEAMFAMVESRDKHGRQFPFAMGWYARQLDQRTCGLPDNFWAAPSESATSDLEVPLSVRQLLLRASGTVNFPDTAASALQSGGLEGWMTDLLLPAAGAPPGA